MLGAPRSNVGDEMRVLFLGPPRPVLYRRLEQCGDIPVPFESPVDEANADLMAADFAVSYGYRYILKPKVMRQIRGRAINLHISMLPWNRGADPNLWSFLENTPKGVTIHLLDEAVDAGPILYQQEVCFGQNETLKTTYEKLSLAIESLFCDNWLAIRTNAVRAEPQPPGGTFHKLADKRSYMHLLSAGWDTPVAEIAGKACVRLS